MILVNPSNTDPSVGISLFNLIVLAWEIAGPVHNVYSISVSFCCDSQPIATQSASRPSQSAKYDSADVYSVDVPFSSVTIILLSVVLNVMLSRSILYDSVCKCECINCSSRCACTCSKLCSVVCNISVD